ncbi:malonyl-CoA decarboxylase family protein, partial [Gammaproteobacteria bacterium]|nr:malonyl-CoA decarboxylase family protein [Gammaproteobacteria bacterium]
MFEQIADMGRELLTRRSSSGKNALDNLKSDCADLISGRSEALGTALARQVLHTYAKLGDNDRLAFFQHLLTLDDDTGAALADAVAAWRSAGDSLSRHHLARAARSPRQTLFSALNTAPDGTAALIAMRRDLRRVSRENPELSVIDGDLLELFSAWFNRGFLEMRSITWQSPADILEKLIAYEAVHAIDGWPDLRRRLQDDRYCFCFFHPALKREPLIFVEVALTNELSDRIEPLIDANSPVTNPIEADHAIFYAISNC